MEAPVRGGSDEGGVDDASACNFLLRMKMAAFGLRVAMGPALLLLLLLGLVWGAAVAIPGGLFDIAADSPEVVTAIRTAVEAFNRGSNDMFRSATSNVISAQAQVVEGSMYHLTLELRTTVCRKITASRNCPFHRNPRYAKTITCRFKVWDRPWVGPMRVVEQRCSRTAK